MIRLLESSRHSGVPVVTATLSFVAHTLLIAGAVVATRPGLIEQLQRWEAAEKVIYLIPMDRAASQRPQQEQVQWSALGIMQGFTGPFRDMPIGRSEQGRPALGREGADAGESNLDAPALAAMYGEDSVMSVLEVDSAAVRYAWSAAPAYPVDMLRAHMEGEVIARYVVDTLGHADTSSFEVVSSTHRAFVNAVKAALPDMRFSPAQWNGQKVRQLVEQRFAFKITDALRGTADSLNAVAKRPKG